LETFRAFNNSFRRGQIRALGDQLETNPREHQHEVDRVLRQRFGAIAGEFAVNNLRARTESGCVLPARTFCIATTNWRLQGDSSRVTMGNNTTPRQVRALASVVLLCVTAACGGGSSAPGSKPVITAFTATPSWVTTGQSATLQWSVDGATSLSIAGIGPVSGSTTRVTAAADANYVLTASNQYGSSVAQTANRRLRASTDLVRTLVESPRPELRICRCHVAV